jgi:prolyl oligopeptidase
MRAAILSLIVLAALTASPVCGVAGAAGRDARLSALYDAEWERSLRENPLRASYLGDHRYDDRWPDLSGAALSASHEADLQVLRTLESITPASLADEDRLDRELFRRMFQGDVDAYAWGLQYLPVTQRSGVQSAHEIAELLPFASAEDYANWIARLEGLGHYVDATIALMREGMRRGLVQPRIVMERVPSQIAKQVVVDADASPFFAPFRNMPATLTQAEQERLRAEARRAITQTVVPAYRRFQAFFNEEYLPAARRSVGVWDTPGGENWYRNRVRWFTTTELTAEQVHEIGLAEVARIRGEMDKVIAKVGFKGSFAEFLQFLRTDPRFRYRDPEQLLQAYLAMSKRIDPLLPQYFGRLPRMPYGVRPIPVQVAPDTTTAYYQAPSLDGRRAGYYYVNLYKPEERPTYEIPVLSVHEAVPGHHLQIALAQELGELPKFRRQLDATAFTEGWGLYSESLGDEMGLYSDPYDKFGQLTYEMWRAVRLVVDTGIHHKRWTREQAIEFFKANAAKSELDIVNEIDRYIAWPGQALAYKIGELRIKELRARASTALGPEFDVREFHDVVLGSGAVPLDVLESNVERWIEARRAASASAGAK